MLKTCGLASQHDCESLRDFCQYYRSRYFGLMDDEQHLCSVALNPDMDVREGAVYYRSYCPEIGLVDAHMSWSDLKTKGKFGSPMLGTCMVGPSYTYMYAYPVRESIKGLGLNAVEYSTPGHRYLLNNYTLKHPEIGYMLSQGRYFYSNYELELVWHVLNKKYFSWYEAVEKLNEGTSLGCPISRTCGLYLSPDNGYISLSYKTYERAGKLVELGGKVVEIELTPEVYWLEPAIAMSIPEEIPLRIK